jgi:ABC-type microcin C transport system duplicated ATPase subunit YejF
MYSTGYVQSTSDPRPDVLNLLVTLKRAGLAIVFITHDLSLGNFVAEPE